jgi:hypothetical protein
MTEVERIERGFQMAELARWHQEMLNHLRDHELRAEGRWPQTTMVGCDHIGGDSCAYIERQIETARQQVEDLSKGA